MTFPLVFISSTLEIVSGEKKTFTANFAQSAENKADPVFIKSDIYIIYQKQSQFAQSGSASSIGRCDKILCTVIGKS